MNRVLDGIEWLNDALFRLAGRLALVLTLVVFAVVALRYLAGIGNAALQESALYLHATLFLIAAAAGLRRGEHVRVDVLYGRMTQRQQAWADLFGTVALLMPFALFLLVIAWDYVARAWAIRETSMDPGGLPLVWALKTLILTLGAQLLLQGLVEFRHALRRLRECRP